MLTFRYFWERFIVWVLRQLTTRGVYFPRKKGSEIGKKGVVSRIGAFVFVVFDVGGAGCF